jgi:hypothetical protein
MPGEQLQDAMVKANRAQLWSRRADLLESGHIPELAFCQ